MNISIGGRKLTAFDIFVILVLLVAAVIIGIRFLTKSAVVPQQTEKVKLTFKAYNVRNEILDDFKEGLPLIINGNYLGDIEDLEVEPQETETVDAEGKRHLEESKMLSEVTFSVLTDAILEKSGAIARGVHLNINGLYTAKIGYIKAEIYLTDIEPVK